MVNLDEIVGDHKVGKKYKDDIKVLSKQETWSVSEIKRRWDEERIIIPKFQREDVWKETRKSRLIESVLRKIPIPSIYLAEEN